MPTETQNFVLAKVERHGKLWEIHQTFCRIENLPVKKVTVTLSSAAVARMKVGTMAMMAFGVGYLTFLRHQAGFRSAGLATPATVLDDARAAAATAQKRLDQQE